MILNIVNGEGDKSGSWFSSGEKRTSSDYLMYQVTKSLFAVTCAVAGIVCNPLDQHDNDWTVLETANDAMNWWCSTVERVCDLSNVSRLRWGEVFHKVALVRKQPLMSKEIETLKVRLDYCFKCEENSVVNFVDILISFSL